MGYTLPRREVFEAHDESDRRWLMWIMRVMWPMWSMTVVIVLISLEDFSHIVCLATMEVMWTLPRKHSILSNMIALMIWGAWLAFGATVYIIMPFIPTPQGINLCTSRVLRIQSMLFMMGWMGKFFAGAAYFAAGKTQAVAMAVCALITLFSVFILGAIFRAVPSKEERIAKLRSELAELEPPAPEVEKTEINPLMSPIYPLYSNTRRRS